MDQGPTSSLIGPEVAPTPVAAPIGGENDIWRDYNPGQVDSESMPQLAPTSPAADEAGSDAAGTIADIVSESLVEAVTEDDDTDVATEALNIDVISAGGSELAKSSTDGAEVLTETSNI